MSNFKKMEREGKLQNIPIEIEEFFFFPPLTLGQSTIG
jgi:hypothetical protein